MSYQIGKRVSVQHRSELQLLSSYFIETPRDIKKCELYAFREIALIINRVPMHILTNYDQSVQPESVSVELGLVRSPSRLVRSEQLSRIKSGSLYSMVASTAWTC